MNMPPQQSSSPMQGSPQFGLVAQPVQNSPQNFTLGSSGSFGTPTSPSPLSSSTSSIPPGPSPFDASPFEDFGSSPFEDVGESPFAPIPTPGQSPFNPTTQPGGQPKFGLNLSGVTLQQPSGPTSPNKTSSSTAISVASPRNHSQTVSGARPQVTLSRAPVSPTRKC
jgi:hypothetical protein